MQRIGVMDLESFFPAKERFALAMRLNNLLASPGFEAWMQGEPLDIDRLLHTPAGKPRIAIFSIAHLSDAERMFFVSLLLNQMLGWVRTQPGTTSLRALLYMDEIFGYFPPVANPPSKTPLLTLLKQARAFGVGVVLATQNPVDLDYKGLANAGTWFIGRLQTERDKARVLEGLEGAAAGFGQNFDRQRMEQTLAGLGNRIFLMNNVHEDAPVVFQVRWALSYLRGPLTRSQIKMLMDPRRNVTEAASPAPAAKPAVARRRSGGPASRLAARRAAVLPAPPRRLSDGGQAGLSADAARLRPGALQRHQVRRRARPGRALAGQLRRRSRGHRLEERHRCHVHRSRPGERAGRQRHVLSAAARGRQAQELRHLEEVAGRRHLSHAEAGALQEPGAEGVFQPGRIGARLPRPPAAGGRARNATPWSRSCGRSTPPRSPRCRIAFAGPSRRCVREAEQATQSKLQTVISFGATVLGAILSRKTVVDRHRRQGDHGGRGVGRSMKESGDVGRAEENVEALKQQLADLEAKCEADIEKLSSDIDPTSEELERLLVKPKKTNVAVSLVALVWAPYCKWDDGKTDAMWD